MKVLVRLVVCVLVVSFNLKYSFSQVPRDYGDAPRVYDTRPDGTYIPARNSNWDGLYLGRSEPDTELAKHEVERGEDNNGGNGDGLDENGIAVLDGITKNMAYSVKVMATNYSDAARTLRGWIDFNMNGKFEASEVASVNVPNNSEDDIFTLTWNCNQTNNIPNVMARNSLYMRIRISNSSNNNSGGADAAFDRRAVADGDNSINYTRNEPLVPYAGEVEGYLVYIKEMEPIGCTDRTYQTDLNTFYSYLYTGKRVLKRSFAEILMPWGIMLKMVLSGDMIEVYLKWSK